MPSASVGYKGLDAHYTSFKSAFTRGSDENRFVKITVSDTVVQAAEDDKFIGRVDQISAAASSSGLCTVQDRGYFENVTYSGTAPTLGDTDLYAAGAGDSGAKVKTGDGSGVSVVVVNVTTSGTTCSFRLK